MTQADRRLTVRTMTPLRTVAEIGGELYAAANMNTDAPPRGATAALAEAVYGEGIYYEQARARRWTDLATIGGRRCMIVRKGLDGAQLNWAIGWGLTALFVESRSWFAALDPRRQSRFCGEVAAWLAAPPAAFDAALDEYGLDLPAIARRFVIRETAAALRIAESATGPRCAVVTERRVYRRGLLDGFDDVAARELARVRRPKSVVRVRLTDEPGRVALFARAS